MHSTVSEMGPKSKSQQAWQTTTTTTTTMVSKARLDKNLLVRDEEEARKENCIEKEQQTKLQQSQPQQQQLSQQQQSQQTQRPAYSISRMTQMARVSVAITASLPIAYLLANSRRVT